MNAPMQNGMSLGWRAKERLRLRLPGGHLDEQQDGKGRRRALTRGAQPVLPRPTRKQRVRFPLGCWSEADAALAQLARLDEELATIEQIRASAVTHANAGADHASRPLRARHARLTWGLERFCRRREPELSRRNGHNRRSRRLLFGRVGFRSSQAVVVGDEARALRTLSHWEEGQRFLRVRTDIDREGLREFLLRAEALARRGSGHTSRPDRREDSQQRPTPGLLLRRLRRAGIGLEQRDTWFYELNRSAWDHWG